MKSVVDITNKQLIKDIMSFYAIDKIECDATYNKGSFYTSENQPVIKIDIDPQSIEVVKGDVTNLNIRDQFLRNMVIDLPFMVGSQDYHINRRYSSFSTLDELIDTNISALKEAYRVLKYDGYLIIKTQDIIIDRRKYFVSFLIMNVATQLGFNLVDEIIMHNASNKTSDRVRHSSAVMHSKWLIMRKRKGQRYYGYPVLSSGCTNKDVHSLANASTAECIAGPLQKEPGVSSPVCSEDLLHKGAPVSRRSGKQFPEYIVPAALPEDSIKEKDE